jgi:uncharacterized protein (DUF1330 family)
MPSWPVLRSPPPAAGFWLAELKRRHMKLGVQRVVIIEFDNVEKAIAAHDSKGYQAALKVLGKAADRDLRIVEGVE